MITRAVLRGFSVVKVSKVFGLLGHLFQMLVGSPPHSRLMETPVFLSWELSATVTEKILWYPIVSEQMDKDHLGGFEGCV